MILLSKLNGRIKPITLQQTQGKKSFYESIRYSLFMFRVMGSLPIEGLLNPDSCYTRFTLKSLYTLLYGTIFSVQSVALILVFYNTVTHFNIILKYLVGLLMTTTSSMVGISLLCLCKNWKIHLDKIEVIELLIPPLKDHAAVIKGINWFVGCMFFIALVEHFTHTLYTIFMTKYCFLLEDDSGWYIRSYFTVYHGGFYNYIPFSYISGFILQILKMHMALVSTMSDVFIVCVTAYLSYRFKNFYRIMIKTIKNRGGRHVCWFELQAHYTRLTTLVKTADVFVSPFVFTAFLSHLLLICKQVYDIIQKKRIAHLFHSTPCVVITHSGDPITIINLFVSLSVLLLRSMTVSLMTAHLHTLSREPLKVLHTAPSSVYNYDMQKFMDQVYSSKVCLSGLRFFFVTRGTVLSMVSTILTYELVLLQIIG